MSGRRLPVMELMRLAEHALEDAGFARAMYERVGLVSECTTPGYDLCPGNPSEVTLWHAPLHEGMQPVPDELKAYRQALAIDPVCAELLCTRLARGQEGWYWLRLMQRPSSGKPSPSSSVPPT